MRLHVFLLVAIGLCLAGCALVATPCPPTARCPPTPDLAACKTEAAATILATIERGARTLSYTPTTAPPSNTVMPSATTPAPGVTNTPSPSTCLNACFDKETIPDGMRFTPGEIFTKRWWMRSCGCEPWPAGTRWVFVGGHRMGAPDSVAVPETALNETAEVAIEMEAPSTLGTYKSFWQMQSPDGTLFGMKCWVEIAVVAVMTPTLTAPPTAVTQTPPPAVPTATAPPRPPAS